MSIAAAATEFTITLDGQDKYNVTWSYEGTTKDDYVTFTITCETTGWVGLGLSPNGGMAGADLAVAWVSADGEAFLEDMHASSNSFPSTDASNDLELLSSSETDGITTISYKRRIATCDDDDNIIKTSTTRLIYAYGSADPVDNVLQSSDYHSSNRGAKSIYLLDPQTAANALPQDSLTHDFLTNDYEIPNQDTEYYCSFHDPPVLNGKHHIVAVEPLVTPGNEGIVHHIVIYACWGVENEHIVGNNKTEGVCFTDAMPEFFGSCRSVFYAWAIGGSTYYFPEEVGFPIGGSEAEGSPQYFLMETHYDNPQLISGKVDGSGIRFHYTPTVRDIDAGTIQIGNINGIFVPPQIDDFNVVGYCHSTCTNQWIPEGGVTFFAYFLHAHLLGVGIKVEQFRDGKSIGMFAEDDAYDFNYQEGRSFVEPKKVMPGDTLKITCNFKSDRTSVTYGGEASSMEMCLAFLNYYPRQEVANCETLPSYMFNPQADLFSELSVTPQTYNQGQYVALEETLNELTSWSPDMVSIAQNNIYSTSHISRCIQTGGEEFPENQYHDFEQSDFVEGVYNTDPCTEPTEPSSAVTYSLSVSMLLVQLILLAIAQH